MSQTPAFDFEKFVPGFDFLKKLSASGPAAMPQASSWVVPSLDPEELDKRIQELKAVQFWLDQNAKALSATIQALEVQRMTLATLRGMNLGMNELAESLRFKTEDTATAHSPASAAKPTTAKTTGSANPAKPRAGQKTKGQAGTSVPGVDPVAWWGSLTEQFSQIADKTVKDLQRQAQAQQASQAAAATSASSPASAKPAPARKTARAAKPSAAKATRKR